MPRWQVEGSHLHLRGLIAVSTKDVGLGAGV